MSTISLPEAKAPVSRSDGLEASPLSALQQGIVYYSLYGQVPGTYLMQLVGTLREPLDSGRFRRAWQETLDRHPVLRASIHMEGPEGARQHVHQAVALSLEEQDWRSSSPDECEARIARFLIADRE